MKRNIILGVIVVLLIGGAFFGGTVFARSGTGGDRAGFPGGAGGPMGNLSEADRAKIQNMTDAERQEFFRSQMGSRDDSGTAGPRGGGGGVIDGEVIEVATDALTVKVGTNSQTIYTDSDTVIAYQDGAAKIAAGSKVLIVSERAADNVVTAQAVVVKK